MGFQHVVFVSLVAMFYLATVNGISLSTVKCEYPYEQIYSNLAKKCLSLSEGPCSIRENDTIDYAIESESLLGSHEASPSSSDCIEGAQCVKFGHFGYCMCASGLLETDDRKCVMDYGQPCDFVSELKCDNQKLLGCIDGKCQCKNNLHEYNMGVGKCVGKVGAFCTGDIRYPYFGFGINLPEQLENRRRKPEDDVICGPGASCYAVVGSRFGNGVCHCNVPFYTETVNRTCEYYNHQRNSSFQSDNLATKNMERFSNAFIMILAGLILIVLIFIIAYFVSCGVRGFREEASFSDA